MNLINQLNTWPLIFRDCRNERHESSAPKKLGYKNSSVALSFGTFDPLQTGSKNTVLTASLPKDPATIAAHDDVVCLSTNRQHMKNDTS